GNNRMGQLLQDSQSEATHAGDGRMDTGTIANMCLETMETNTDENPRTLEPQRESRESGSVGFNESWIL
ncbi:MAG: hypothetical protein QME25_07285, partial [Bacteroidota bacterium]|nr:hypothetical protein [Bacteroidota bacterium]